MSRDEQHWPHEDEEETPPDQASPNDSTSRDERSPDDGPSEKQIRANRENAKKSTGPRSAAGKARSSRNSRRTGIHFSKIEPVTDGSFAEDPEEFYERVGLLVEAMHPRDPVELEVATRIAGVLVKLERLDRWSAASIAGAAVMRPADIEAGARSEARVQLVARAVAALHLYLAHPHLVDDPDYETMAMVLRYQGPEDNVKIEGFWDEENTPTSREDWRRAYEALKNALWSDHDEAVAWASGRDLELSRQYEQVENLEERIAANRILNGPFELQLRYEARLLSNLRVLRREYAELQKRGLTA